MTPEDAAAVAAMEEAALEVLHHNQIGPYGGLMRTAGWGYPEPYTRDLMISSLGILASGDQPLIDALRRVLSALAQIQTAQGHIPSLASDPYDTGASDTTPLFLVGLALYRRVTGESRFLEESGRKSLAWLRSQSPDETPLLAQQPTSDWRDEQWVLGYGLYVNVLVTLAYHLWGMDDVASELVDLINRPGLRTVISDGRRLHEGLAITSQPYFALWRYKVLEDLRFDLLGNSLAVLSGITSPDRSRQIAAWVDDASARLRQEGQLSGSLPPVLMPRIHPSDPDWHPRYERFNPPGEYHNGGIWPFVSGFYVASLAASGLHDLAEEKLLALVQANRLARRPGLSFGFNEWLKAQDGSPRGQDWQTWSAAMALYAAACVRQRKGLFMDELH